MRWKADKRAKAKSCRLRRNIDDIKHKHLFLYCVIYLLSIFCFLDPIDSSSRFILSSLEASPNLLLYYFLFPGPSCLTQEQGESAMVSMFFSSSGVLVLERLRGVFSEFVSEVSRWCCNLFIIRSLAISSVY